MFFICAPGNSNLLPVVQYHCRSGFSPCHGWTRRRIIIALSLQQSSHSNDSDIRVPSVCLSLFRSETLCRPPNNKLFCSFLFCSETVLGRCPAPVFQPRSRSQLSRRFRNKKSSHDHALSHVGARHALHHVPVLVPIRSISLCPSPFVPLSSANSWTLDPGQGLLTFISWGTFSL